MTREELMNEGAKRYGSVEKNAPGHIEKCKECGKEFETDTEVYSHLQMEHGYPETTNAAKSGGCAACGHNFYEHSSTYTSNKLKCKVQGCACPNYVSTTKDPLEPV